MGSAMAGGRRISSINESIRTGKEDSISVSQISDND